MFPHHKTVADRVKRRGCFLSLHSDGNVTQALPGIVELGFDVVHPWQETAGMDYGLYLREYADRLGLLGGLCIQSTLGFGDLGRLEAEIRRVFGLLKGKRWMFCTTHFVQEHCSIEELVFAYDLAVRLARD
jgi:uroporphyrinogen decarboxylase